MKELRALVLFLTDFHHVLFLGIGLLLGRAWGGRSVQKLQAVASLDPGPNLRLNPDWTKGVQRK
jgi:hypothetical protein